MNVERLIHSAFEQVNTSPKAEIKLIDFGLSSHFGTTKTMTQGVGTMYVKFSFSVDLLAFVPDADSMHLYHFVDTQWPLKY